MLEPFVGKSKFANHGQRVVEGQRLMQAASDIMLGWFRTPGIDGVTRDFYIRQLWDGKASALVETMSREGLTVYAEFCARTLARAHARSGDPVAIASYIGRSDASTERWPRSPRPTPIRTSATSRPSAAVDSGRITAETEM